MPSPKIELTTGEWSIIKAVWDHEPCAAPAVQELLAASTGWTYSTVRTMMDRMVAKGLLTSEKLRNLTLYRSAVTRQQAQRSELGYALRNAFNGALTPMVQCLIEANDLSPDDLTHLENLLKAKRKGKRK